MNYNANIFQKYMDSLVRRELEKLLPTLKSLKTADIELLDKGCIVFYNGIYDNIFSTNTHILLKEKKNINNTFSLEIESFPFDDFILENIKHVTHDFVNKVIYSIEVEDAGYSELFCCWQISSIENQHNNKTIIINSYDFTDEEELKDTSLVFSIIEKVKKNLIFMIENRISFIRHNYTSLYKFIDFKITFNEFLTTNNLLKEKTLTNDDSRNEQIKLSYLQEMIIKKINDLEMNEMDDWD